jgi:hypothetical protein
MVIALTGSICLLIGLVAGAWVTYEYGHIFALVRTWTLGFLSLCGIGTIVWIVLHFVLHAV